MEVWQGLVFTIIFIALYIAIAYGRSIKKYNYHTGPKYVKQAIGKRRKLKWI